jgi:glucosyl-dolichyl phosphate glucuronosyltransferase
VRGRLTMDVSVVICAHDEARWTLIKRAISSAENQDRRAAETIVVIDHNDRLLARARSDLSTAKVVENSGPRGLGGARNSGISRSSGEVVAFLDDDAVACPAWLSSLVEPYEDPTVAAVGGSIEPMWECGRPGWFPHEFDWVVGCSYRGMPAVAQDVRNLFGCNMSYRRDLLNALGNFRLGYGCDETELCIRLRTQWPSRRILYIPAARVFHHVPAERARFRYFLERCYFEGGSKAVVSVIAGSRAGLSAERHYTRTTLPKGVMVGVGECIHGRDVGGLARAGSIVAGLTAASAGYVCGRLSTARAAQRRGWCGESLTSSHCLGRADAAAVTP